jgi:hypothetical protein
LPFLAGSSMAELGSRRILNKTDEMDEHEFKIGRHEKCNQSFSPEISWGPHWEPSHNWVDNIKIDLWEVKEEDACIQVALIGFYEHKDEGIVAWNHKIYWPAEPLLAFNARPWNQVICQSVSQSWIRERLVLIVEMKRKIYFKCTCLSYKRRPCIYFTESDVHVTFKIPCRFSLPAHGTRVKGVLGNDAVRNNRQFGELLRVTSS